ncbi:MAG: valine--tRNA ligase [Deltaproteobacteria bacterium]|nr:valine--tRNA ligase [Deltaproteobacteria bacterium]
MPIGNRSYDPQEFESRIYQFWLDRRAFEAEDASPRESFSIVIPPPNITGSLHMGHALTATIQDTIVRYQRMLGKNALWLPGTDHAGIATQMVVERHLAKTEKLSRHDLGREKFVERVWEWRNQYGGRITEQHKALGASVDWGRERFTLDDGLSRAVREAFVRLYEDGLIYRAERMIQWCPRCRTALSDLEVVHVETKGELWSFAYPLADGSGEIVVATTRPETMLGDTAVAVHPEDERHRALIGRSVRHPILDRTFAVVGDPILVDPKFGTGAVKVTPAHDPSDFECGRRNALPFLRMLDEDGKVTAAGGPFAGLDRAKAREAVKEKLTELGLFRGSKEHVHAVGRCQRCETVVEPMVSTQWFANMKPLAEPAIAAVREGKTVILPEQWTKTYFHWLEGIQDWCISRQLWWGHRIPAWYCPCGETIVAREAPAKCPKCGGAELRQDEDVLDTWFSSGLWPCSTLGWPAPTPAFRTFYPTSVMETGFDILFFWVARMMMMGLRMTGEVPFRTVVLHGMVLDAQGRKMSKTRGNAIDPLDVTAKFGTDALRFTLASYSAQGQSMKLDPKRIEGYRFFCNKIWNAVRFMEGALGDGPLGPVPSRPADLGNRWILSRLDETTAAVRAALDGFRLDEACAALYAFTWRELCDWYIEWTKPALYARDPATATVKEETRSTLQHVVETTLRLLHPVIPFLTEELWQEMPRSTHSFAPGASVPGAVIPTLARAPYPAVDPARRDTDAAARFQALQDLVTTVRSVRAEYNIGPSQRITARVVFAPEAGEELRWLLAPEVVGRIGTLCSADVTAASPGDDLSGHALGVAGKLTVAVPLAGIVDVAAERVRHEKELAKVRKELEGLEKRLANPEFTAKAPGEVVAEMRERIAHSRDRCAQIEDAIQRLAQLV